MTGLDRGDGMGRVSVPDGPLVASPRHRVVLPRDPNEDGRPG